MPRTTPRMCSPRPLPLPAVTCQRWQRLPFPAGSGNQAVKLVVGSGGGRTAGVDDQGQGRGGVVAQDRIVDQAVAGRRRGVAGVEAAGLAIGARSRSMVRSTHGWPSTWRISRAVAAASWAWDTSQMEWTWAWGPNWSAKWARRTPGAAWPLAETHEAASSGSPVSGSASTTTGAGLPMTAETAITPGSGRRSRRNSTTPSGW
jgi:hypothetical protein